MSARLALPAIVFPAGLIGCSSTKIRVPGMKALLDRLGLAGTVRFLQQFDAGSGDYTQKRQQWLKGLTVDEISADVERNPT